MLVVGWDCLSFLKKWCSSQILNTNAEVRKALHLRGLYKWFNKNKMDQKIRAKRGRFTHDLLWVNLK